MTYVGLSLCKNKCDTLAVNVTICLCDPYVVGNCENPVCSQTADTLTKSNKTENIVNIQYNHLTLVSMSKSGR